MKYIFIISEGPPEKTSVNHYLKEHNSRSCFFALGIWSSKLGERPQKTNPERKTPPAEDPY